MKPKQINIKSYELCKYIAHVYRQRREELGLTKEDVAALINRPVSTVTKSENSFRIGLNEVFILGEQVYGLDMLTLFEEAETYAETIIRQQNPTSQE